MKKIKDVFKISESRFHGQVYTNPDSKKQYDVPEMTYFAQDNFEVEEIPLKELIMSKSDEKHGSDEFKKHAEEIKISPIVVVELSDGRLQIADGNHRAYKAVSAGMDTIPGYVVPFGGLPDEALVNNKKGKRNG